MAQILVRDVIEAINADRFRDLLRNTNLPVSGSKQEIITRIVQAVNNEIETEHSLTVEILDDFLASEIAHGKNRILFISSFPEASINKMKDVTQVKESLMNAGFPTENFNNLKTTYSNEEMQLVLLNIQNANEEVHSISMCFARADVIIGLIDEEGEELPPRRETDYFWVDILPFEQKIIIKMRQKHTNEWANRSKVKEIYEEISTIIREAFSLAPRSMGNVKNLFYQIFKDLTETAEKPFRDKVAPFKEEINETANSWASKIGLHSSQEPVNLTHRLTRLLERALIQQDFDEYERYFEGKRGIVTRIYYSDATGASVNARSSEREEGIAVADIYFDTKESIEGRKVLDKLWITWFYKFDPEKPYMKIETKFEAYKEHYTIHFLYAYTTKEIQNHVLSNLKHYEEIQGR
jgi:hypothetical protein